MPNLPRATTSVSDTAGSGASGLDTIFIMAPGYLNADCKPRKYGNAAAIMAQHGYNEGVEYAALHADKTRKTMLFACLPIEDPGVISREDTSGNSGSSVSTVTEGPYGCLTEHDGILTVIRGGTVGTSQIMLGLSLDGGRTTKRVRLGTGTSYTIPYVGVGLSFTVGTLVAGDTIHTWHGSGPKSNADGWALARAELAKLQSSARTALLCGDLSTDTEALALLAQFDAYRTANERFFQGRASIADRLPQAAMSQTAWRMTGSPSLTFAEVGETGDTITRQGGSWIADGAVAGDTITVAGSASNNITGVIAEVSTLVLTLDTTDLVAEGPRSGCTVVGCPTLTFAEVGETGDTITRSRGSWLADGFRDGDSIAITGTSLNNVTADVADAAALVLTLGTTDLVDEVIKASSVTVAAGQTKAAWLSAVEAEFSTVDDAPRISLSVGRGAVTSPLTGWAFRRPAAWALSLIEYQHDVHVAPWRKDIGPCGFSLLDVNNELVEWDDRVDGEAASQGRFTSFRTWANGPGGTFLALGCTRAKDDSLLVMTHNQAVVDLACNVCQLNTENAIGRDLILNDDGTATTDSLSTIESFVNAALELELLKNKGEGVRCSSAVWTASTDDILNVPEALLTGVLTLNLKGTIHSVTTQVRVVSGGQ